MATIGARVRTSRTSWGVGHHGSVKWDVESIERSTRTMSWDLSSIGNFAHLGMAHGKVVIHGLRHSNKPGGCPNPRGWSDSNRTWLGHVHAMKREASKVAHHRIGICSINSPRGSMSGVVLAGRGVSLGVEG